MSSKYCESLSPIASEAIWEDLNSKFFWGGIPQTPLVGTHAYTNLRMLLSSCYHPVSFPQLKIPYETLHVNRYTYMTHTHMWQSHMEIEDYSFGLPSRVARRCIRYSCMHARSVCESHPWQSIQCYNKGLALQTSYPSPNIQCYNTGLALQTAPPPTSSATTRV